MVQLSCKNVTMTYENTVALKDVSFEVQAGDYLCIVGENGSGKSTLIKGILGLTPVKSGTIAFSGGVSRDEIGYLPQQTEIQRNFPASVYEVVLSGCLNRMKRHPFYGKSQRQRAIDNLKRLGIEQIKNKSYQDLSGGQQQRVLLARALCATEKMLLLDEPITGLDPIVSGELYEIIGQLNRQSSVTILMVSHDVSCAVKYATKILHLSAGVSFFGDVKDYLESDVGRRFTGGGDHA